MPPHRLLTPPASVRGRELVAYVGNAGVVDFPRLAARFFQRPGERPEEAHPRAEAALRRLVKNGYLSSQVLVQRSQVARTSDKDKPSADVVKAYSLTPAASESLRLPPPPELREHFVMHHLKTLEAVDKALRGEAGLAGEVLRFKMETQLMSEAFAGKDFRAQGGAELAKLPDAMLVIREPGGAEVEVYVEYVTRNYSDKMIAEKASAWAGRPTLWAAPNAATAARVAALTGQPVVLV